jgi:hypothetical protein
MIKDGTHWNGRSLIMKDEDQRELRQCFADVLRELRNLKEQINKIELRTRPIPYGTSRCPMCEAIFEPDYKATSNLCSACHEKIWPSQLNVSTS